MPGPGQSDFVTGFKNVHPTRKVVPVSTLAAGLKYWFWIASFAFSLETWVKSDKQIPCEKPNFGLRLIVDREDIFPYKTN
jgi:hypothetical protein